MDDISYNDYDNEDSYYDDFEDYGSMNAMPTPTLFETYEHCVLPSLKQITNYMGIVIGWNVLFRLGWNLCGIMHITQQTAHAMSFICGCGLLYYTVGNIFIFLLIFSVFAYIVLKLLILFEFKKLGYSVGALCISALIICELTQANPTVWHKIRGMQMVVAMKIISLAVDMETQKNTKSVSFLQFLGYILCPASVVVGPWVSYREYSAAFAGSILNMNWILWTLMNIIFSVWFLISSNCLAPHICTDNSWKWFVAFRDAISFRCSHYFVSFLSQATMSASGAVDGIPTDELSRYFGYIVTKPSAIEIPRSLGKVVINWNIPMHRWLKTYVFKVVKVQSTLLAVFATYLISSLLHGINFQIYAVLLSLGIYTFVEYNLRYKISVILNACTLSTNCRRNCSHDHKSTSLLSCFVNLVFSALAIFHLAYLGVMFDAASSQDSGYSLGHAIGKWSSLDFLSHWVILATFLFNLLI